MPTVYNLKDITATLGLKSPHAARKRVNALRELLQRRELLVYIPEQGGALGVKQEGLQLLHRLQEIGREGKTLAQATEALLIELGEAESPADPHELRSVRIEVRKRFEEIDGKIKELAERVVELERKRPWWQKLLALPRGD